MILNAASRMSVAIRTSDKDPTSPFVGTSAAQAAAEKRHNLQKAITRRIPGLATDPANAKLTGKFKEWWHSPTSPPSRKKWARR